MVREGETGAQQEVRREEGKRIGDFRTLIREKWRKRNKLWGDYGVCGGQSAIGPF